MEKNESPAWVTLKIRLSPVLVEAVSNRLLEVGASGVHEKEENTQLFLEGYFEETLIESAFQEMVVYCEALTHLFPKEPPCNLERIGTPDEDWAEKYREFYRPQRFSRLFFLRPTWDETTPVPPGRYLIRMEPGQAFGTGEHPTTRLCVRLLERLVEYYPKRKNVRVLDVGTGSGILGIVSSKLGFGSVEAVDNDPVAVEVANDNFKLNEVPIRASVKPLEAHGGPFEIVVANILLETHLSLLPHYCRLLGPGGVLILSGLLVSQLESFLPELEERGLGLELVSCQQEWASVQVFRRSVD